MKKIVGVCLLLIVLFLKLPVLDMPYYWDALTVTIPNSVWVLEHNFYPIPLRYDTAHPPLLYLALALLYRILGIHLWVSHLLIIFFGFLGVYFTYLLGLELGGNIIGFCAALLLLFSPTYFAQSGIINFDIPLTALTVATIYFAIKNNLSWCLVSGICLVLIKEPGGIVIFPILIYSWITNHNEKPSRRIRTILLYSIPLFVSLGWFLFHYYETGWFYVFQHLDVGLSTIWGNINRIEIVFYDDFKFIFSLAIFFSILFRLFKRKTYFDLKYVPIVLTFFLYILSFLIIKEGAFIYRYMLPTLPLFFILGAKSLSDLLGGNKSMLTAATITIMFLFTTKWYGDRTTSEGSLLESNMEYLDVVETHKMAAKFIEQNYPNATVLTSCWKSGYELRYPYLGYVQKPVNVKILCLGEGYNKIDLIYFSAQEHGLETLNNFMREHNTTLLKRFKMNGKYAEVYTVG